MKTRKKNVISIEDRIPKLKQARKKKANRRLITYLSVFFLLIVIIVYLQSPLSDVKTIEITGNSFLTEAEIINESNLDEQSNIWTINRKKIENTLKKHEIVQEVKVTRVLPWTVAIKVNEHRHVGYLEGREFYYPLIGNGKILNTELTNIDARAPLLVGFEQGEFVERMAKELNELSPNIVDLISEIHWVPTKENENKVLLYMIDGYTVNGTIRNFSNKMEVYPSIIAQLEPGSEGVIHLGVGAYFENTSEE